MTQGSGIGLGLLIAAQIVCCGGLALAATGALSSISDWLTTGGYLWTGAAAGAFLVGLALLDRWCGRAGIRDDENAALGHPTRPAP